jgi:hypothetical protein
MTYATPTDVALDLRGSASPLTSAEQQQWQAWLNRVERSIERAFIRLGLNLETAVAGDSPRRVDVKDVEVAAVVRRIQNPNPGFTSVTRSVDDAQITTRNEGTRAGRDPLELTEDEWAAILPQGRTTPAIFSVMPS